MDTNDYCAIPQQLKDQVSERYPGARQAYLKTGGDFPFLSRPDEVNLHLQLHLRRVGIEARPDLVHGISNDGGGGSSSKQNDEREDADDAPEDDMGSFESPSTESQPPPLAPESTDSHNLDDQPLSNAEVWATSAEYLTPLLWHALSEKQQYLIATKISLHLIWEFCNLNLLPLYMNMGTLYINWKYCWKIRLVM
uniref:Putative maspardin n=1 Tax=Davidia involucrata TaxID=16924 RepID=A0A5B6ZPS1_DAVIN